MTDTRYRVMITDEVDPEGIALLYDHPAIEVVGAKLRNMMPFLDPVTAPQPITV